MIFNSFDVDFIHSDIHGRSCKKYGYLVWIHKTVTRCCGETFAYVDIFLYAQRFKRHMLLKCLYMFKRRVYYITIQHKSTMYFQWLNDDISLVLTLNYFWYARHEHLLWIQRVNIHCAVYKISFCIFRIAFIMGNQLALAVWGQEPHMDTHCVIMQFTKRKTSVCAG